MGATGLPRYTFDGAKILIIFVISYAFSSKLLQKISKRCIFAPYKNSKRCKIYQKLLFGKLEVNEGMLIENIVAQMLTASGNKLFFYSKSSEEAEERMEIDFLLQKDKVTSRHNIRPIEVKSGKNYTLSSLKKCMNKFGEYMTAPTVLHAADYKVEDGITYLPLYMTPLL